MSDNPFDHLIPPGDAEPCGDNINEVYRSIDAELRQETGREKLQHRRHTEIADGVWRGIPIRAMVSRNALGRVVEVFIDPSTKSGTDVSVAAKDGAILASICLQRGATVDELLHSLLKNPDGHAAGIVGAALELFAEPPRGP